MTTLHTIAAKLVKLLEEHFDTVRITTVQTSEQMLLELDAINPGKLPAVLIVFDRFALTDGGVMRESSLTLVLIDRFTAQSSERALSVFEALERLFGLFPPHGRELADGVRVYPADCAAASPARDYACLALGITVKQGI